MLVRFWGTKVTSSLHLDLEVGTLPRSPGAAGVLSGDIAEHRRAPFQLRDTHLWEPTAVGGDMYTFRVLD